MQAVSAQAPPIGQAIETASEAMDVEDVNNYPRLEGSCGQGRVLYSEHGQKNPTAVKAAKKRSRKLKARA